MHRFFYGMYLLMSKRKFLSACIVVFLFLSMAFFALRMQFSEDITRLIPSGGQSDVAAKVMAQVSFADKISVIISGNGRGEATVLSDAANQFLDSIAKSCRPYIGKIQGKIEDGNITETIDFVYANLPLFLNADDYRQIQNRLQNDSIGKIVEADYKSLVSPTGIVTRDFIRRDPLGLSFIALKKLEQLSIGADFQLQDGFIITKDRKNLLLFITPKLPVNETDRNFAFIQKLSEITANLNKNFSGKANIRFYGATPVAVANATQIKSDVRNTSIFAALSLIVILVLFYRNITTPVIIFIPSMVGAAFAMAVLYVVKGSISAISLGISSILLGETTDYSIYVLTHLRNNRDVKLLYKDISKPLILCGATTAVTFLCLYFVKSDVLNDLGIFAALSVISTSVFSLVLIPLLYKSKHMVSASKQNAIDRICAYPFHKNRLLIALVLAVSTVCVFNYRKATFNNNLAALNYVPTDLQQAERTLERLSVLSSKSVYLACYGNNREDVLNRNNNLFDVLANEKKSGRIANFSSVGGIIFSRSTQLQKIAAWHAFWTEAKKNRLKSNLVSGGEKFGLAENAFGMFYQKLDAKFEPAPISDYAKIKSMFTDEFIADKHGFHTILTLVKIDSAHAPEFIARIRKQPNLLVIDRQQMNETFLGSLKSHFENLIDYSFIAIFLILLLAFKRLELVIVSIVPIGFSWILTTGIMGILGLQFNIINIIVCTLIFGIGVDYSIFMTTALQKEHTYGKKELPTYKTSILLSVATTILGIGVLGFAKHPALQSIAFIATIGIVSTLIVTFILQPVIFGFWVTYRVRQGKPPFRMRTLIHGSLSFFYYGFGGFVMSVLSLVIMPILPMRQHAKMKAFRYIISKFMKSVLYTNPFVSKKVIFTTRENFDKPAVIIANHTSFLDILAVGMLSPKIIYLVSDWVYHSPVFGAAVRKAGFYPVSDGIDGGVGHLRSKVAEGFSLVIFPEGTRSKTNQMKRFHKGAFYLADHFGLDILPVLIHGNSETLPKGDFIIYDGSITVKILDRIAAKDARFGTGYSERAKNIAVFFKQEFDKMRVETEGPDYFRKELLHSFDYKETAVVKAVRRDFSLHANVYYRLNASIKPDASVLHLAGDYGQLDVLLTLQQPKRRIDSFIGNSRKRDVAHTNYFLKRRNISYISAIGGAEKEYDVVLISGKFEAGIIGELAMYKTRFILLNNAEATDIICNFGARDQYEEPGIIILNNK